MSRKAHILMRRVVGVSVGLSLLLASATVRAADGPVRSLVQESGEAVGSIVGSGSGDAQPAAEANSDEMVPDGPGFPIAWYDSLDGDERVAAISSEGLNTVLPYHHGEGDARAYLDAAQAAGVEALVEIPRSAVNPPDHAAVAAWVSRYKAHPALLGWYLADEPSMNWSLGPLSPENAAALYRTIKTEDPAHPVAISFAESEDPTPYKPAMDVLMHSDYPALHFKPEFYGLLGWRQGMIDAAALAASEDGFFSILQAYGERRNILYKRRRLPTKAEERYMTFTSLEVGATGLFYWARFWSPPEWVRDVLKPIVSTMNRMEPALATGGDHTLVSTVRRDVRATTFRTSDGATSYVVAIHHGEGTYDAPLKLTGPLAGYTSATLLGDAPQQVAVTDGTIQQTLGSFEVKIYKLGA